MSLKETGTIAIPNGKGSSFDHAAFDTKTRRVFITHTARDCVEVIDHDARKHVATLPGFPGAAGLVAEDGEILVTNRVGASLAWVDAVSFETKAVFRTGGRPNGVAIVKRAGLAIAACIGEDGEQPTLHRFRLTDRSHSAIELPGRPRWCVTDVAGERLFLAVREPSIILVASLPELAVMARWKVPSGGAHGLEIDHERGRLYVACDDAALVELDSMSGEATNMWPLAGAPDVTFLNPATGLVHVAIGDPGLVQTIDPRNGSSARTMTGRDAHTTAIVSPDTLYVISPEHGGLLVLSDRDD